MRQYNTILRLLIRNMLRPGGDKKRSGYVIGAYVGIGLFCAVIAAGMVLMTYTMTAQFDAMGLIDELVTLLLGLGCLVVLFFGLVSMLSVLYFSRDTEFFLSLPVKPSVVYMAKLTLVYLSELVIAALLLIPSLITVGVTARLGALYYIAMFFGVLTVPCLPLLLASIIAIPLMYVVSFFRNRGALTSIVLILLFALFFGGYYFLFFYATDGAEGGNVDWEQVAASMRAAMVGIANGLYPLYALAKFANTTAYAGMSTGLSVCLNLLIYVASIGALIGITVFVSGTVYRRGAAGQLESARTAVKANTGYVAGGAVRSLIKKEWRELMRTPAFAFQSLSGILLCPIVMLFMGLSLRSGNAAGTAGEPMTPSAVYVMNNMQYFIYLGMICIMGVGMNLGASTCISREGQNFYFCKMIPVPPETQVRAKTYLYLLISAVPVCIGLVISAVLQFDILMLLLSLGFLALYDYGYVHFTILFDLYRPKLVWATPNEAVKNNRSAVVPMFINIGVSFVIILGPILLMALLPEPWVGMLVGWLLLYAIAVTAAIVFRRALYRNAARLYAQISL